MVWHCPETPVSISNVKLLDFLWKIGKVELKFTPSWCIINLAESIFSSEVGFFFVRYGLVPQKNKFPLSLPKEIQFICDCNWRLSLAVILGRCLVCTLGSWFRRHLQASGINACEMEYSLLSQTVSSNPILWVLSSLRYKLQMWAVSPF